MPYTSPTANIAHGSPARAASSAVSPSAPCSSIVMREVRCPGSPRFAAMTAHSKPRSASTPATSSSAASCPASAARRSRAIASARRWAFLGALSCHDGRRWRPAWKSSSGGECSSTPIGGGGDLGAALGATRGVSFWVGFSGRFGFSGLSGVGVARFALPVAAYGYALPVAAYGFALPVAACGFALPIVSRFFVTDASRARVSPTFRRPASAPWTRATAAAGPGTGPGRQWSRCLWSVPALSRSGPRSGRTTLGWHHDAPARGRRLPLFGARR